MSQEPSVLLVDLPEGGAPFAQALTQVGRPSVAISPDQIKLAFEHGRPLCIVALSKDASQIAAEIRDQNYSNQLPFFVLQPDAPGSIRPPLPEVTAVVPDTVEPGILALRIQTALQQAGGPRPRQATVLGMGSMSQPPAHPSSAPSKPPKASPLSSAPPVQAPPKSDVPPVQTPPKSSPLSNVPPVEGTQPESPDVPAEVPWDTSEDRIVSSVPPKIGSRPGAAASPLKPAVVSSAPPLPEIGTLTPSGPNIPEAAPLPAGVSSPSNSPTTPPAVQSNAETVPTHPPVALAAPEAQTTALDQDEMALKKPSWIPRALIAAGVLLVVGVGGVIASGGDDDGEKGAATPSETTSETSVTTAAKPAESQEPAAPPTAKGTDAPSPGSEPSPEPETVSGEAVYYLVENQGQLESCEKALGKTAADYSTAKKWQASQSWKMARKSLMAGSEDKALQHMCEATFIDPAGPATVGLAKYYLGKRSLDQAHTWARKAVEVAAGANSKRTAQQVLGDVFSQMGKPEDARKVWLESFNLTEDQTERLGPVVRNFINAAVKARKGGDPALAEQLLRRATTFEPDNVNASALLAATLLDNGEKKLAKLWAERALKKKPGLDMAEEVLKAIGG